MENFSAICAPNFLKSCKLPVKWELLALFSDVIFSMLLFQGSIFTHSRAQKYQADGIARLGIYHLPLRKGVQMIANLWR